MAPRLNTSAAVVSRRASPADCSARHVVRRAQHGERLRHRPAARQLLGNPEVGDLRIALGIDQDVAGLEIAMNDSRAGAKLRLPRPRP